MSAYAIGLLGILVALAFQGWSGGAGGFSGEPILAKWTLTNGQADG